MAKHHADEWEADCHADEWDSDDGGACPLLIAGTLLLCIGFGLGFVLGRCSKGG